MSMDELVRMERMQLAGRVLVEEVEVTGRL